MISVVLQVFSLHIKCWLLVLLLLCFCLTADNNHIKMFITQPNNKHMKAPGQTLIPQRYIQAAIKSQLLISSHRKKKTTQFDHVVSLRPSHRQRTINPFKCKSNMPQVSFSSCETEFTGMWHTAAAAVLNQQQEMSTTSTETINQFID